MPVFNIAQPQELDLTPVTPKTYSVSTSEFIQLVFTPIPSFQIDQAFVQRMVKKYPPRTLR